MVETRLSGNEARGNWEAARLTQPQASKAQGRAASPVIDYGRGKTKRRTSKAAVLSLFLSLLLSAWAAATYWVYADPAKGLDGIGSLLLALAMFWILGIAAFMVVPGSVVAGVVALVEIRREPDRVRGWAAALFGIGLAVAVGSAVIYAKYELTTFFAKANATFTPHPVVDKNAKEKTEIENLLTWCRIYASRNGGAYPPDFHSVAATGGVDSGTAAKYLYVGQGISDEQPGHGNYGSTHSADDDCVIIVITPRPNADGLWLVGMKGHTYASHAQVIKDLDLRPTLDRSNQVRRARGLTPIDFSSLLGRPDLARSTD